MSKNLTILFWKKSKVSSFHPHVHANINSVRFKYLSGDLLKQSSANAKMSVQLQGTSAQHLFVIFSISLVPMPSYFESLVLSNCYSFWCLKSLI